MSIRERILKAASDRDQDVPLAAAREMALIIKEKCIEHHEWIGTALPYPREQQMGLEDAIRFLCEIETELAELSDGQTARETGQESK